MHGTRQSVTDSPCPTAIHAHKYDGDLGGMRMHGRQEITNEMVVPITGTGTYNHMLGGPPEDRGEGLSGG